MRITHLKLRNFGPHEKLDFDMDAACVGILGPNGSGKTNILDAVGFAFTGLFPREKDSKDFVRHGQTNGSVEAGFVQGGRRGRIFRQVGKTPKRELKLDGDDKTYTRGDDVNRLLAEVLDCDRKALDMIVFMSQGKIGDFLFKTPAVREEEFAKICMLDHLPLVADIIGQEINRIQKDLVDYTAQKDEAASARSSAKAALRTSESELETKTDRAPAMRWLDELVKAADHTLEARQSRDAKQAMLRAAEAAVAGFNGVDAKTLDVEYAGCAAEIAAIETAAARHAELEQQLATRREWQAKLEANLYDQVLETEAVERLATLTSGVLKLRSAVAAAEEARQALRTKVRLEEEAERRRMILQASQGLLRIAPEPLTDNQKAQVQQDIDDRKLREAGLQLASSGCSTGLVACPVCQSKDLSGLPSPEKAVVLLRAVTAELEALRQKLLGDIARRADLAALRAKIEEQGERLAEAEAALSSAPTADRQLAESIPDLERNLAEMLTSEDKSKARVRVIDQARIERLSINEVLTGLKGEKDLLSALEAVVVKDDQALREKLRKVASRRDAVTAAAERLESAKKELAESQTRLAALEHELTNAGGGKPEAKLGKNWRLDLSVTLERAEELRLSYRLEQAAHDRVVGEIKAHTETLRRAELRLAEIKTLEERNTLASGVIAELEQLRAVFGRGGIQRGYLTKLFRILVAETQHELLVWEDDFTVEEDQESTFNFLFSRTSKPDALLDQSLLSGGQRVRLALSFAMALQRVLYPGLNFLCVDEPSNHLDPEGTEGLMRLFRSVAEEADNDAQVLVVDHKPELQAALGKSMLLPKLPDPL